MRIESLLQQLREAPGSVEFDDVLALISRYYNYVPTAFRIGSGRDVVLNPAGTNEGSCRIFAFARLHDLDREQTLACFGRYYREDVLAHPDATDHANIRAFLRHGPAAVAFDGVPLRPRVPAG